MGINILTRQFKANIIKTVNESMLPPAVVRLVLEDILNQVISQEEEVIKAELCRENADQHSKKKPGKEEKVIKAEVSRENKDQQSEEKPGKEE